MTRLFCIDTAGGWRLAFVCFSLLLCSMSSAIVRHNDTPFSDHPSDAVVGSCSTNSSCIAIDPNYVVTVRHAGVGVGSIVKFDGISYKAAQISDFSPEDIRIIRITTLSGQPAGLLEYAQLYMNTDESSHGPFTFGGYGKYRGNNLGNYGYSWQGSSNNTLRWATNYIDDYNDSFKVSPYITSVMQADFDQIDTTNEGIVAEWDSGGGWFIQITERINQKWVTAWNLIAISAYTGHIGEPPNSQSWFDNPNLFGINPDHFFGLRISTYASEIYQRIDNPWIISGYVNDHQNQPISDVTITGSNSAGYTTTDLNGYYEIYVPNGWTGNLSASKTGYVFSSLPSFTDIQTNRTDQNFTVVVNQNVSDNFNDNVKSSNWLDISQDYANINVVEANEVLQFTSTNDACDVKACYQSNEWSISTAANFSLKIDFHHLVEDANDYFAYFKLICDANNYACIGIGSEAGVQYYEMQVIENSDVNAVRHTVPVPPATILDGKLYVYYSQSSDYLYLSLSDYGTTTNGILSKGVLVNGWASQPAKIEIGLTSNNCQILPGEVFFDNFIVNTGNLSDWPPKTDINRNGFVDIEDLCEMAGQWLNTGGGFSADIDSDGYVDFVDLARLAEVW